jgi:hypothetical protein
MRTPVLSLVASLLVVPTHAFGVPPPIGFSLEGALFERAGATAVRVTAVTSCWVEGWLEAEARLGFGSADRPQGRATAAVTPALGLRWGPELGRWRPLLGVEAGVLLPADGQSTLATGAARAGLQWFARRDLALSVELADRWTAGVGGRVEAVMGIGYFP